MVHAVEFECGLRAEGQGVYVYVVFNVADLTPYRKR